MKSLVMQMKWLFDDFSCFFPPQSYFVIHFSVSQRHKNVDFHTKIVEKISVRKNTLFLFISFLFSSFWEILEPWRTLTFVTIVAGLLYITYRFEFQSTDACAR